MGLYDDVDFKCKCPICGAELTDFQTKDAGCHMGTVEFWEVDNFYCNCDDCGAWIEFSLYGRKNKKVRINDYILEVKKTFSNIDESEGYFENPTKHFKIEEAKRLEKWKRSLNENKTSEEGA